jgi:hypothetical protein
LICLGIIGEYLGRVFNEIKPRLIYVVERELGDAASGRASDGRAADGGAGRPQ